MTKIITILKSIINIFLLVLMIPVFPSYARDNNPDISKPLGWDKENQLVYFEVNYNYLTNNIGEELLKLKFILFQSLKDKTNTMIDVFVPADELDFLSDSAQMAFQNQFVRLIQNIKSRTEPLLPFKISDFDQNKIMNECSNRYFNTEYRKVEPWKKSCDIKLRQKISLHCNNNYNEFGRKCSTECTVKDDETVILTIKAPSTAGLRSLKLYQIPETQSWVGTFDFSDPFHTPVWDSEVSVSTGITTHPVLQIKVPENINPDIKRNLNDLIQITKALQKAKKMLDL